MRKCLGMGKEQVLKEVRAAESRVREMLEEAELERDKTQTQAGRDAETIVEEGLASVDKLVDEEYQKSAEDTGRLVKKRINEGKEVVDKDKRTAKTQLPQAIDRLVEELEKSVTQG